VNASSFDKPTSTYFALVNNFPGKSNSTLDQKLVKADFSQDAALVPPPVTLLDLETEDVMLQFVAYSTSQGLLYFSGPSKTPGSRQATVGVICHVHGKIHSVLTVMEDVLTTGPIVADDDAGRLYFFMKFSAAPNEWVLYSIAYSAEEGTAPDEVHTYKGDMYSSFAAATFSYPTK
jgi:hypothetical protein